MEHTAECPASLLGLKKVGSPLGYPGLEHCLSGEGWGDMGREPAASVLAFYLLKGFLSWSPIKGTPGKTQWPGKLNAKILGCIAVKNKCGIQKP